MTIPRLFKIYLFMIKIPPFLEIRIYNAYINISFLGRFVNVCLVLFLSSPIIVLQSIILVENNAKQMCKRPDIKEWKKGCPKMSFFVHLQEKRLNFQYFLSFEFILANCFTEVELIFILYFHPISSQTRQ